MIVDVLCAPKLPHNYPPLSSMVAAIITASLSLFYCRDHACKTRPARPICAFPPLVFLSPRAPTPQSTHTNPMRTHPGSSMHFFLFLSKHDVRGNFPGHRGSKHVMHDHFCLSLPCFCASWAPCTLTHPSAPMRTHLHLFTPVCTLLFHVYMCNLIKKIVSK